MLDWIGVGSICSVSSHRASPVSYPPLPYSLAYPPSPHPNISYPTPSYPLSYSPQFHRKQGLIIEKERRRERKEGRTEEKEIGSFAEKG